MNSQPQSQLAFFCILIPALWRQFGEILLRIYLAGEVQIESDGRLIREADLPARQGRLAFVHLASHRDHALSRDELADAVWPGRLPPAWGASLSAIISKLRAILGRAGLDRDGSIVSALGC